LKFMGKHACKLKKRVVLIRHHALIVEPRFTGTR